MSLSPGAHLGPYEVVSLSGVGGMGEVYRATDTELKRQVAIKILPSSLAADPNRLARFQREAYSPLTNAMYMPMQNMMTGGFTAGRATRR